MPSVAQLKQRLSLTLKARKMEAALDALEMLERKEPKNPLWPGRAARVFRATANSKGEISALRRALELQVDQGLVLDAIASCQALLEVVPEDRQTLETLDLLYLDGSSGASALPGATREDRAGSNGEVHDRGLDELVLSEVVPGARAVQVGDCTPGRVNEIPIDGQEGREEGSALDLRLDEWSSSQDLEDLAAAQAVCLPRAEGQPSPLPSSPPSNTKERGASLRAELANVPLFGDLDPASLHTLIRKVRVLQLAAGQVLFREGDPANSLYVVVDGAVVPIAEGSRRRKLAVLERGEFFGEIGLMAKQPRNATIEALVDTKLLEIDRRVLWELIQNEPSVAKGILRFLRARLIDRQMRTNLFFSAFVHAEREAVARQFRFLEVDAGATVVEAGRPPEGLFVVLSGSLSVLQRGPEGDKEIDVLSLGDVFGGLSLMDGHAAPAAVVASGKCWLVVLGEGRFRRILEANPRLDRILRRIAVEKGRGADEKSVIAL